MLTQALEEFVAKNKGTLRVGDEFAISVRDVDGSVAESGKVEHVKFCNTDVIVHSQIFEGPETKPRRRMPDEDTVYIPRNLCFDGDYDLSHVEVEVTSRGYVISRTSKSTEWIRHSD